MYKFKYKPVTHTDMEVENWLQRCPLDATCMPWNKCIHQQSKSLLFFYKAFKFLWGWVFCLCVWVHNACVKTFWIMTLQAKEDFNLAHQLQSMCVCSPTLLHQPPTGKHHGSKLYKQWTVKFLLFSNKSNSSKIILPGIVQKLLGTATLKPFQTHPHTHTPTHPHTQNIDWKISFLCLVRQGSPHP